jgi:hypothetical protein
MATRASNKLFPTAVAIVCSTLVAAQSSTVAPVHVYSNPLVDRLSEEAAEQQLNPPAPAPYSAYYWSPDGAGEGAWATKVTTTRTTMPLPQWYIRPSSIEQKHPALVRGRLTFLVDKYIASDWVLCNSGCNFIPQEVVSLREGFAAAVAILAVSKLEDVTISSISTSRRLGTFLAASESPRRLDVKPVHVDFEVSTTVQDASNTAYLLSAVSLTVVAANVKWELAKVGRSDAIQVVSLVASRADLAKTMAPEVPVTSSNSGGQSHIMVAIICTCCAIAALCGFVVVAYCLMAHRIASQNSSGKTSMVTVKCDPPQIVLARQATSTEGTEASIEQPVPRVHLDAWSETSTGAGSNPGSSRPSTGSIRAEAAGQPQASPEGQAASDDPLASQFRSPSPSISSRSTLPGQPDTDPVATRSRSPHSLSRQGQCQTHGCSRPASRSPRPAAPATVQNSPRPPSRSPRPAGSIHSSPRYAWRSPCSIDGADEPTSAVSNLYRQHFAAGATLH